MAKREAHARSVVPGEEMPATLSSAAEEHARALKRQLLESTEQAAKTLVGQTRAEGERRIDLAGRRAQAIGEAVTQVEQAEQAVAERTAALAEAAMALRSELNAFAATLSAAEKRLSPKAPEQPELRLVEDPATGGNDETGEEPEVEGETGEPDENEEAPTPDQIAQFFREHGDPDARGTQFERKASGQDEVSERVRRFFMAETTGGEAVSGHAAETTRLPLRDRLYTDIGGAVIGLGGAAALINFVLLK